MGLKVLHILNELKPSGAEVMLLSAGPYLSGYGIDGEILSTGPAVGSFAEPLAAAGYRIHHLPFSKSPTFFVNLYRFLKANRYDVVHLHTEGANFWRGIVALLTAKRSVRTIHNNFPFTGNLRWRRKWQRQLLDKLGLVHVSISPSVQATELQHFGLKTRLIPNWYNSERFRHTSQQDYLAARRQLDIPANRFAIVSVGNCSKVKNHTALIEALATLNRDDIVYLHIGIEPNSEERDLAEKLGISALIRFEGMQADILPYLQAADLYAMPSTHEGFSIAALEAIATGMPALFAKVPGLADLATYFQGLAFCPPDPAGVAHSLAEALQQTPAQMREATADNPQRAEELFGIKRGLSEYLSVYRT